MNKLFDALEICLQEIENGATLDSALSRFPEFAAELRPILQTAAKARSMAAPEPSPDVTRRSRARVMQRAAEMRESKVAPRRRMIPLFQRLAISFALAAVFLLSGNGLLSASASALPGENLYPVKRSWESIRLFFIFDNSARESLEQEFENERLHEANELLLEGRHEDIQFAGVFMQVNGLFYVSGLRVILPGNMNPPASGDAVLVLGRTNAQGFIEITSMDILPAGSVVPIGMPVEVEIESESGSGSGSANDSAPVSGPVTGSESEAVESPTEDTEIGGILQSMSINSLVINGMTVYYDDPNINAQLCVGMVVEVKGYYKEDGRFIVLSANGDGRCSGGDSSGTSSSSGSNSNGGSNSGDDSGGSNINSGGGNSSDDNLNTNGDDGEDNSNTGNSGEDNSNTGEDGGNSNSGNSNEDNSNGGGGDG